VRGVLEVVEAAMYRGGLGSKIDCMNLGREGRAANEDLEAACRVAVDYRIVKNGIWKFSKCLKVEHGSLKSSTVLGFVAGRQVIGTDWCSVY